MMNNDLLDSNMVDHTLNKLRAATFVLIRRIKYFDFSLRETRKAEWGPKPTHPEN